MAPSASSTTLPGIETPKEVTSERDTVSLAGDSTQREVIEAVDGITTTNKLHPPTRVSQLKLYCWHNVELEAGQQVQAVKAVISDPGELSEILKQKGNIETIFCQEPKFLRGGEKVLRNQGDFLPKNCGAPPQKCSRITDVELTSEKQARGPLEGEVERLDPDHTTSQPSQNSETGNQIEDRSQDLESHVKAIGSLGFTQELTPFTAEVLAQIKQSDQNRDSSQLQITEIEIKQPKKVESSFRVKAIKLNKDKAWEMYGLCDKPARFRNGQAICTLELRMPDLGHAQRQNHKAGQNRPRP